VLKEFYKTTYRGIRGLVRDGKGLRDEIGLRTTPHWTAIQKACDRLLTSRRVQSLIDATVKRAIATGKLRAKPRRVAIDTSGFESQHVSRYYAKRRRKTGEYGKSERVSMRRYPKLVMAVECDSHVIVGVIAGQGDAPARSVTDTLSDRWSVSHPCLRLCWHRPSYSYLSP
jgi:hypothetical protein